MTDEEREHAITSGKITVYLYEEKPIRLQLEQGEVVDENDDLEPMLDLEISIYYKDFPGPDGSGDESEVYRLDEKDIPECVMDLWGKLADRYNEEG